MASSPAEPRPAASTPRAAALQELTACWDQAYEALARGDLERVEALLDVAQDHVAAAGDGDGDSAIEAQLRAEARSAHGRLAAGMRGGLVGLQEELTRTRRGAKAMRGYGHPGLRLGGHVVREG